MTENAIGDFPERGLRAIRPLTALALVTLSMLLILGAGLLLTLWLRHPGVAPDARAVIFAAELLLLIPEILYIRWRRLNFLAVFRLNPVPLSLIVAAIVLTVGLIPLTDVLDRLIQVWIPVPKGLEEMLKLSFSFHNRFYFWLAFLSATLFAGTFEEMLFRGFLQGTWELYFSAGWAIGISATLFAVVHLNPWWLVQILLLGLLLGYIAFRSNSVVPGIFIHVLNNTVALLFLKAPDTGKNWYSTGPNVHWYWVALGLILFTAGFVWMTKIWDGNQGKEVVKEWN